LNDSSLVHVVVADDSAYLRKKIADILNKNELINIIDFAKNGEEAVDKVKKHNPDVLVLDLVMPKMNGLDAFKLIMEESPTPTVILSAISPKNLDSSIQALLMGAFDYIIKPGGIGAKDLPRFREELLAKVLLASQSKIKEIFGSDKSRIKKGKSIRQDRINEIFDFGKYLNMLTPVEETEEKQEIIDIGKTSKGEVSPDSETGFEKTSTKINKVGVEGSGESGIVKPIKPKISSKSMKSTVSKTRINSKIQKGSTINSLQIESRFTPNLTPVKNALITSNVLVIGASVGGPRTITAVLKGFPITFPAPILVVQHLSAHFTEAFAQNLDIECKLNVKVATNGEHLRSGIVYISPGENHMEITVQDRKPSIRIYKGKPVNFCMPSIDVLFFSAARIFRNKTMGVILTGMGTDGVEGLGAIKRLGGKTIAESEETCILFAMPKTAAEKGYANFVLPNYEIHERILKFI